MEGAVDTALRLRRTLDGWGWEDGAPWQMKKQGLRSRDS